MTRTTGRVKGTINRRPVHIAVPFARKGYVVLVAVDAREQVNRRRTLATHCNKGNLCGIVCSGARGSVKVKSSIII